MTFTDPVVAGTTLIRAAIRSPDYVPGVSGWSINRDGSAEFNDAVFRGEVLVRGSNGGYIQIWNDGGDASIDLMPDDEPGFTFDAADIIAASNPTSAGLTLSGPTAIGVPTGAVPQLFLAVQSIDDPPNAYSEVRMRADRLTTFFDEITLTADTITLDAGPGGTTAVGALVAGSMFANSWSGADVTVSDDLTVQNGGDFFNNSHTWTKPALQNGWTNRGGIFPDLQYRRYPTSQHVQICGEIVPGTLADGTLIATLPAGFRPVDPMMIICRDAASSVCFLQVNSNGQILIFDAAGSTLVQITPTVIPLDTTT